MQNKFNCFDCQQRFNTLIREPILMMCCSKTACRHCVTTKMITNKENGERGIARKGEFECSGCNCKYYSNVDTEQAVALQVNFIVKDLIA